MLQPHGTAYYDVNQKESVVNPNLWIEEKLDDSYGMRFRVTEVLFTGKSKFQEVDVVRTAGHGVMLLNDGYIMLTERDEFAYHDMIAHVPLFVHPNPKRVLIIGGGDGGTAREVLRHPSVEECVVVEIDSMVVQACRDHIPQTSVSFDDDKVELIIGDGVAYVAETNRTFDVVLVDSTDPIGPAQPLFGEAFYRNVHRALASDGIVVSQGETPWYRQNVQRELSGILHTVFARNHVYNFSNLSYPGGLWSFTFASKGLHPLRDVDANRAQQRCFHYYNNDVHWAAFALPTFQQRSVNGVVSSL